jgi:RNA-directed DNA polymerase
MKRQSKERLPERVPFSAIPTGETLNLFAQEGLEDLAHLGTEPSDISQWAHQSVWTDRMLETLLNNKVKGGKWHALNDKVFSEPNLLASAVKVLRKKGAAGVDQQTVTDFAEQQLDELNRLREELCEGRYCPQPVRRAWIPKPGSQELRLLGIPTVAAYCTSSN